MPRPAPLGDPNAPLPHRRPTATHPTAPPPQAQPPISPQPTAATAPPPQAQPPITSPPTGRPEHETPTVRWNNDDTRQGAAPGAGRGTSAPRSTADENSLIPLPDLDAESESTAPPKPTSKAPTLADTLLGARAKVPEAALPAAAQPPAAERWVRPEPHEVPEGAVTDAVVEASADGLVAATTGIEVAGLDPNRPDASTEAESDSVDDFFTRVEVEHDELVPEQRPRSDRLVNIGVVLLAVVLAAGAAYFLLRDDSSQSDIAANERRVNQLAVGDCFGGELLGASEIETVPIVDCGTPHQYEVFHATVFEPSDAPFDAEKVRRYATDACTEELESIIGATAAEAPVQLLLLNPTAGSWNDEGDRTSLCLAYDPEGPLSDPIAPS
ncbi:MAG: septum formation family protein [Acidimicrobiia bacterium]|nr:septum formation family protein [Acidimicrobiia bacterium]